MGRTFVKNAVDSKTLPIFRFYTDRECKYRNFNFASIFKVFFLSLSLWLWIFLEHCPVLPAGVLDNPAPNQRSEWFHRGNPIQCHQRDERGNTKQIRRIDKESMDCLGNLLCSTRFRLPEKRLENIDDPISYKEKCERCVVLLPKLS